MESVYEANELLLGVGCFALMLIVSEAGFRLLGKSGDLGIRDTKSQHLTVEAGILGVLGLLLDFTMSMLAIIVDVDRPREGLIRVSQQSLLDLQKQLRSL